MEDIFLLFSFFFCVSFARDKKVFCLLNRIIISQNSRNHNILTVCFWYCRRFNLIRCGLLFLCFLCLLGVSIDSATQPKRTTATTLHFKLKWRCQQIAATAAKSAFLYHFFGSALLVLLDCRTAATVTESRQLRALPLKKKKKEEWTRKNSYEYFSLGNGLLIGQRRQQRNKFVVDWAG